MAADKDWWRTFFRGNFVEMWLRVPTAEQDRLEVGFLEKALQLPPQARVLDVPCGGGRHSLELAARGHRMTGVDLSSEFLTRARAQSAERGLAITWEERDMRDLPWPGAFDGAFCFGNSFAYLDDEGNAAFLQAVGRVLKPQARFAMNLGTVAESILPTMKERFWMEIGNIHFLVKNQYDHVAGRLESELTLIRDGQVEKRAIAHRVYAYSELCRLLEAAGFGEIQGYASAQQEPYRLGSPNLFLVATKVKS